MDMAFLDPTGGPARNAEVAQATALVERRLAEWDDLLGGDSVPRLAYTTRSHGGAFLFRVTSRRSNRAVAAKLFRERSFAGAEYRMAREVEGLGARVVRALRCDEELGLVVSEWAEGEKLAEAWRHEDLAKLAAQAGEWLRRYHREAQLPSGPAYTGESLARFAVQGHQPRASMDPEERREFARVTEALASQVHLLVEPLMPVRLHGDFQPMNLIVTPGGLVAVDLLQGRSGSRFEDVGRMTVWFGLAAGTQIAGFDGDLARTAFLDGYGLRGRGARQRLRVAEALELLRRWHMARRPGRPAPRWARAARTLLRRAGWLDGR